MTNGVRRRARNQRSWAITAAATFLLFLTACSALKPLMGEAPPNGYIGGNIPSVYRGRTNPYSPDNALVLEAGRSLYGIQCLVCHGEDGRGYGPKAYYLEPRPADFSAPPMLKAFREHQDYTFWWVSEGVVQTAMPAFQNILSEDERWQVITYAWYLGQQASKDGSQDPNRPTTSRR